MSIPTLHIILFASLASLFVSTGCANQSRKDVALFIFGDSINDAGTNNYINTTADFRANFPPYGETFFHHPTGRFSDGRLIADFIAEHAKLPLIPPYLQKQDGEHMGGANFASAGAGALVDTYKGFVVDFKMQLKQLRQLKKKLRKKGGIHFRGGLRGEVIGNITTVLKGIYKVGGRKFAVIGIGPLGCVPGVRALTRNGSCSGEANKLAKLHNTALTSILTKLETQLQGFEYSYFDLYTSGIERILYPSKYGRGPALRPEQEAPGLRVPAIPISFLVVGVVTFFDWILSP
ncbi:hypothetical protein NL676_014662 [Syzygium grande]|nr:hypothetical protein NL676_014662 [Syzygium grande]